MALALFAFLMWIRQGRVSNWPTQDRQSGSPSYLMLDLEFLKVAPTEGRQLDSLFSEVPDGLISFLFGLSCRCGTNDV